MNRAFYKKVINAKQYIDQFRKSGKALEHRIVRARFKANLKVQFAEACA